MIYRPKTIYRHFMSLVAAPGFFIFDMFCLSGVAESSSLMSQVSRPFIDAPPFQVKRPLYETAGGGRSQNDTALPLQFVWPGN
jgi:hypothetical protein